jgi:large subunit ribosomal protein L21
VYAVIRAGGKQHKVTKGDVVEIERLKGAPDTVEFTPLLVVDDKGAVTSDAATLAKATVTATVVEERAGTKLHVLKYKNKIGYRRRMGHRQRYTAVEISDIKMRRRTSTAKSKKAPSEKATSEEEQD